MKNTFLFALSVLLISCNASRFTNTVPSDFKIEYNQGGGKVNMNRHIVIQKGACLDEGREAGGIEYKYVWQLTDSAQLQDLYTTLNNLHVFTIPYKNEGQVMDRGGEKLSFTIGGKTYRVDNSGSNFIDKKDGAAFDQAVKTITSYADKNRLENTAQEGSANTGAFTVNDDTANVVNENNTTLFPAEMPDDFKITYNSNSGFAGFSRILTIKTGQSIDEGRDQNGRHNISFNVKQSELKKLYESLRQKNAFTIRYQKKGMVYDRGGVELTFHINSKEYIVSDKDDKFVIEKDQEAFKSVVKLIEEFADKYVKN